jgi:hypothetical protein
MFKNKILRNSKKSYIVTFGLNDIFYSFIIIASVLFMILVLIHVSVRVFPYNLVLWIMIVVLVFGKISFRKFKKLSRTYLY